MGIGMNGVGAHYVMSAKNIHRIRTIYKKGNLHYTRAHMSRVHHVRKRKYIRQRQTQFGVYIPTDVHDALVLDKNNNNGKWKESMQKEMGGIRDHRTFLFLPPGSEPPEGYQEAPL